MGDNYFGILGSGGGSGYGIRWRDRANNYRRDSRRKAMVQGEEGNK